MKTILLICSLLFAPAVLADDEEMLEKFQDYLDFSPYAIATISVDQLASLEGENLVYIDTRNQQQFDLGHIPGAKHIEWREVLNRRDEIPKDKPVIMYCETGLLSSKAQFILRMAGYENIKVLWGGYLVWASKQSFVDAAIHSTPERKKQK